MAHFALSAIGVDRPGIVAAVSGALLEHGVNIEDSQMTILRGHFTMMLVVAAPPELDRSALAAALEGVAAELGLEAISLKEVEEREGAALEPSHTVAVYGLDHPGIVHAVSSALAERGVNITDLNTRLVGEDEAEPLYALMMEVVLPAGLDAEGLARALAEVRRAEGVEVTVRELEQDPL